MFRIALSEKCALGLDLERMAAKRTKNVPAQSRPRDVDARDGFREGLRDGVVVARGARHGHGRGDVLA